MIFAAIALVGAAVAAVVSIGDLGGGAVVGGGIVVPVGGEQDSQALLGSSGLICMIIFS
jgi:hypothetical protein